MAISLTLCELWPTELSLVAKVKAQAANDKNEDGALSSHICAVIRLPVTRLWFPPSAWNYSLWEVIATISGWHRDAKLFSTHFDSCESQPWEKGRAAFCFP